MINVFEGLVTSLWDSPDGRGMEAIIRVINPQNVYLANTIVLPANGFELGQKVVITISPVIEIEQEKKVAA